ncbi:MAG: leucine-rich repeat domain-containing protein [Mycoplasma sp.]
MKLKRFLLPISLILIASTIGSVSIFRNHSKVTKANITLNQKSDYNDWEIVGDGLIKPKDTSKVKGNIVIPAKVGDQVVKGIYGVPGTSGQGSAFYNCQELTSVTISEGIKTIGDNAFIYCRNITSMVIPHTITSIGYRGLAGINPINAGYKGLFNIYTDWSIKELSNLIIGEDLFFYVNNPTFIAKNPNGDNLDLLEKKYIDVFKHHGEGVDPVVHFILDTNILGPVLGGVFGGIGAIGLATGTVLFIKKRKQK